MKIVVIGGSGLIGKRLVSILRDKGHQVIAASPSEGINSVTGEGLREALAGAAAVVDVSNSPSWEDGPVMDFFQTSTRNLLAAEATAGVQHHVALSVVGSERLPDSGYFRAKIAQEAMIKRGAIPYTIVRATQFFEFIKSIADFGVDGDVIRLPPIAMQPVAAADVSAILADVAVAAPLNGTAELAGPEMLRLDELARRVLRAQNDSRQIVADPRASYYGAPADDHTLMPGDGARLGPTRLDDWLKRTAG